MAGTLYRESRQCERRTIEKIGGVGNDGYNIFQLEKDPIAKRGWYIQLKTNALLSEVVNNNIIQTDDKKVTVYFGNMETVFINPDSTSAPERLDNSKQYDVTMITDTETGLINGILIVMK